MNSKLYLNNLLNLKPTQIANAKIVLNMTQGKGKESCLEAWLKSNKDKRDVSFSYWSNYGKQKNFHIGNLVFGFVKISGNRYLLITVGRITNVPDNDFCSFDPLQEYKGFLGRLIIELDKGNTYARYVFNLSTYIESCEVVQILQSEYGSTPFPGFENMNLDYVTLRLNIDYDEWKYPLSYVKGIYMIFDISNGKKYIGSAYGAQGIYGRWKEYLENGYDESEEESGIYYPNKQLKQIVNDPSRGINYIKNNFIYSILEVLPTSYSNEKVIEREKHWKMVMHTINTPFGYNSN
jgi:hypothetical protein